MTSSIPKINLKQQYSVDELLSYYRIQDKQLERIREAQGKMLPEIDKNLDEFYIWMREHADMMSFFNSEASLRHVKDMQKIYWQNFMQANVDEKYIADRRRIGEIHAKIGLPVMFYMAGVSKVYDDLLQSNRNLFGLKKETQETLDSIVNLLHLDAGLICQSFVDKRDQLLNEQSQAVLAMSTPVTEIWDGILLLPIVGLVDSKRSEDIMNAVLECIKTSKAKEFILDISGVGVVDTAVANYLISITKATALMGCRSTISGISPSISKTIVQLGVTIGDINTTSTMMDALAAAFASRGITISNRSQV